MGAKQSKRSVDISGKEADSAGEVAAAIAGGEGRVEQLADADALKPQLNGDAHIHETEEKQKDVDSGTPENEKDATTEKEGKQEEGEPEAAPLTNGESEQKMENGDSTPTSEDGKKPKKEKVKKKWSLRSISFSRKDKPKQEKKSKDEEAKTNGEPAKVPEETAEVVPEAPVASTETAEEAKTPSDIKEDKTPETPVTEPITNGSSTPETPKDETPVIEEPSVAAPSPVSERPEPKAETEPEQLPVNGLSLEEPVKALSENEKKEDSKEEPTAETTETVPEILVKKEVCVEQMPLIDPTPPPLPANPPPSSVASFAATTMAPELTDASLANTADNAIPRPSALSDPNANDEFNEISPEPKDDLTVIQTVTNELPYPAKEASENVSSTMTKTEVEHENIDTIHVVNNMPTLINKIECETIDKPVVETVILLGNGMPPALNTLSSELVEPVTEKELDNEQIADINEHLETAAKELVKESISENLVDNKIISDTRDLHEPSSLLEPVNVVQSVEKDIDNENMTETIVVESVTLQSEIINEIKSINVIEKEIVLDNNELEMPPPPSELIEEPVTERETMKVELLENMEPELPAPPMEVVENSAIEKEELPIISDSEMPAPPAEVPVLTESIGENLPSPPPPICEEPVFNIPTTLTPERIDTTIIPETKEIINSNNKTETEDICSEMEINNDNEDIEQNIKNKSKDSLGNFIDTAECNGNLDTDNATLEQSAEKIVPSNEKDIAEIESLDAEVRTAAPSENIERESSTEPPTGHDTATPQEVLPVSDKLADLIPEVPEVPEIITETLQETTNDVAVTN